MTAIYITVSVKALQSSCRQTLGGCLQGVGFTAIHMKMVENLALKLTYPWSFAYLSWWSKIKDLLIVSWLVLCLGSQHNSTMNQAGKRLITRSLFLSRKKAKSYVCTKKTLVLIYYSQFNLRVHGPSVWFFSESKFLKT